MSSTKREWAVYAIVNKLNGTRYFGQTTTNVQHRFKKDLWAARGGQSHIARAIREQGAENFELAGWLQVGEKHKSREALNALEKIIIKHTGSQKNGYNTNPGGSGQRPAPIKKYPVRIVLPLTEAQHQFLVSAGVTWD